MNISDYFIPEPSEDDLALEQHQIELEEQQKEQSYVKPSRSNASHANASTNQARCKMTKTLSQDVFKDAPDWVESAAVDEVEKVQVLGFL